MEVDELDTPSIVVDLTRLERNISRMSDLVRSAGVRLRPHTKTHKTPEVAALQVQSGAAGLTASKLGEAEVMADAGFEDIFVANVIVGEPKVARLARLADRIHIRSCVDGREGACMLSEGAQRHGTQFEVLLDVDTGLHRTGVDPNDAVSLGRYVAELPGLELIGVFTYAGNAPGSRDAHARKTWAEKAAATAVAVARNLRAEGIAADEVSVAGSSSAPFAISVPGVTEVRPGQYVFNDMNMCRAGISEQADCALTVRARVVSRPAADRAVIDAGSKALTTERRILDGDDPGFGAIESLPNSRIDRLWEEHGVILLGEADRGLRVGDIVSIIPNHVCPTINLTDRWFGVRDSVVEREFRVAARGATQ